MVSTYTSITIKLLCAPILIYQFHCFAIWFMFCCFSLTCSLFWSSVFILCMCVSVLAIRCHFFSLSFCYSNGQPCIHTFERTLLFKKSVNVCTLCNADYQRTFDSCFTNGGTMVASGILDRNMDDHWNIMTRSQFNTEYQCFYHVRYELRCNSMQFDAMCIPLPIQSL